MKIRGKRFDLDIHKKIDVYAFAIILYEAISQESAWAGLEIEAIMKAVVDGQRPSLDGQENFKLADPILTEIMQACWQQDPSYRPSFRDVCQRIENYFGTLSDFKNDSSMISASKSNTMSMGK